MEDVNGEEHNCNPALAEELAEDVEKIKGDAIGNTLYSERWVLKTIIKLVQIEDQELDEEFESELCLFWDMTIEKDVISFLMKHDFLSIATKVVQSTGHLRLIEIVVGVVGNMCCVESVREELSHREATVNTLLALFETPDSAILIQLVRLFHSTAWDLVHNPDFGPHWLENEIGNERLSANIAFILTSSTNEELIYSVLEFLNTICSFNVNDKDFSQYFSTPELVKGLIECWDQLFANWNLDDDFPSKYHHKAAKHWTAILCSFVSQDKGRSCLRQFGEQLGHIFNRLTSRSHDSIDVELVSTVTLMEAILGEYFSPSAFKKFLHILHNLYQNLGEPSGEGENNLEPVLQECIESYCASVNSLVSQEIVHSSLSKCNENHVLLYWKIINDRQVEADPGERTI